MKNNYISIGIIVKPQGIKGQVKIKPFSNNKHKLLLLKDVFVENKNLSVVDARLTEGFLYMTFKEVKSRNEAELLRNKQVCIPRDQDELEEGEYYISDLINADIVINNTVVGKLLYIDNYGSADVYTIKTIDGKEGRFPALKITVLNVDVVNKRIILDEQNYLNTVTFD